MNIIQEISLLHSTSVNIYVLKYNTLIYYIVTSYIFNNLLLCFVVACKRSKRAEKYYTKIKTHKSNNIYKKI